MDRTNFSHHIPRRLPAEVVYDSVVLATGSDEQASKLRGELDDMAIAEGKPRQRNQQRLCLAVFGQSIRESNCDCDRSDSPQLAAVDLLAKRPGYAQRLADKNGWVAQACKSTRRRRTEGSCRSSATREPASRRSDCERQFVGRIRQFNKQPEARQEKMRPQLDREYERVAQDSSNTASRCRPWRD